MAGTPIRTPDGGGTGPSRAPASPRRPAPASPRLPQLARAPDRHARGPRPGPRVSGFADNDAGGITTYSLVGANFGYALLWVILASQIVLFFTQEVGARLGLATGKGLIGLIRERWGVRWTVFAALADAGREPRARSWPSSPASASALGIFGVPPQISAAVAAVVVVAFIALGSYSRVQYLFVGIGIAVSAAYVFSAVQAAAGLGPGRSQSLVHPQLSSSPAYWLAVVGTVGTTITPVGPGLHPVVRRRQGPAPGRPARRAGSTSSRARCSPT